jgi:hypothetical protein
MDFNRWQLGLQYGIRCAVGARGDAFFPYNICSWLPLSRHARPLVRGRLPRLRGAGGGEDAGAAGASGGTAAAGSGPSSTAGVRR